MRRLICVYLFPVDYWPPCSDLCIRCREQGVMAESDPAALHICRGHLAEDRINVLLERAGW